MNAFQAIPENISFVESFLTSHQEWKLFKDYGTEDRNHAYIKVPIQEFIEFLTEFKFQNMPDAARKQATLRYVKYLSTKTNTPLTHGYIIHMAYASREARLRAFNEDTQRLVNLHSGRSTTSSSVYPEDAAIKFEDSLTIQIHKVKLKCDSVIWSGREAYTLAIYYPEDFAINYVETEG